MLEHNGRKIITNYWAKPIPTNKYDWEAVFDDYDGAPDSNCPIGHGATQKDAVQNLIENCEEL